MSSKKHPPKSAPYWPELGDPPPLEPCVFPCTDPITHVYQPGCCWTCRAPRCIFGGTPARQRQRLRRALRRTHAPHLLPPPTHRPRPARTDGKEAVTDRRSGTSSL
jgi:hypothetical protein